MSGKYSVLIVDDSAFVRQILTAHLEGTEYQIVAEAENGAQAVRKYEEHRPDLALLDIIMPDKTGEEALALIMQQDPSAKVVVLSSLGTEDMVTRCLAAGAKSFLQKPFDKDALLEQLRNVFAD